MPYNCCNILYIIVTVRSLANIYICFPLKYFPNVAPPDTLTIVRYTNIQRNSLMNTLQLHLIF